MINQTIVQGSHVPPQLFTGFNHQRIIMRCDSTNESNVVPQINMSACILDNNNQKRGGQKALGNHHVNLTEQMTQLQVTFKK